MVLILSLRSCLCFSWSLNDSIRRAVKEKAIISPSDALLSSTSRYQYLTKNLQHRHQTTDGHTMCRNWNVHYIKNISFCENEYHRMHSLCWISCQATQLWQTEIRGPHQLVNILYIISYACMNRKVILFKIVVVKYCRYRSSQNSVSLSSYHHIVVDYLWIHFEQ